MNAIVRALTIGLSITMVSIGLCSAQGKIKFDPTRDLPGFEESRSSEDKDLFPLDPYVDMLGREMDAQELAGVQAKWKTEFAAIHQHLDELRTDPVSGVRWILAQRMAKHPFFSKVTLTLDTSVPPFMVFIQKPSFDDPNYTPSIMQLFTPYLSKLQGIVEEHVAKPSGAKRKANRPLTPIVVLASPGDLENYYRLGGSDDSFTRGADYNSKLDLVIFAVNSFEKPKATAAVLHPLLRETFLSLTAAHVAAPLKQLPSMWLREGMASAFTWPRGGKLESLDKPEIRSEDLKLLVELCGQPAGRITYLQPVAVLSSLSTWEGLSTRASQNFSPGMSYQQLSRAFLAQSSVWMHFLTYGKEGKYRAPFEAYVKTAMIGQSGADALSFAFAGTKLAELDREFWEWVFDEHKRLFPAIEIDKADLALLFAPLPKPGLNDEIVAAAKKSLEPAKVEPPFDPSTLALGESDVESRHGLALQMAVSGDLEGARRALEVLAGSKPAAPEDGRIARDVQRLTAAIALREGFLAALIAKNGRLAVEVNGKKVNAPIVKVENGQVVFGENTFGVKSLALASLSTLEVARQADKKELQGSAPAWTRPWMYMLSGDARWEKLLKADSPEAREVKEDGTVWYRERLQSGVAAKSVEALSKLALPKSRAEAEPIIASIRDLLKAHPKTSCVLLKKDGLSRFARAALEVSAAESDGSEFVNGKLTKGSDGVATLLYEFDDRTEADDFKVDKGHLLQWRQAHSAGSNAEESSTLEWKEGSIALQGNAMWRLPIGFIAPLSLRVEFDRKLEDGKIQRQPSLAFHVCDDGQDSYVHVTCYGWIAVNDSVGGGYSQAGPEGSTYHPGQKYKLEITHDGRMVTSLLDGVEIAKTEAGKLVGGGVEVLAVCDGPASLHRLEITGKVDPASLSVARANWVTKMLAEMGF